MRIFVGRGLAAMVAIATGVGTWAVPPAAATADTTPPVLASFSQSTPTLTVGGGLSIAYTASDASGVASAVFHFTDPLGNDRPATGSGANGPATAGPVDSSWPSGAYRLDRIDVTDGSPRPNTATYAAGSTAFDLDAAGFTVDTGTPAPAKPPISGVLSRNGTPPQNWQPVVNGYVVQANWADLQPTAGGPIADNNVIDQQLATVRSLNANALSTQPRTVVKLRIYAGDGAPEWAKTLDGPPVSVLDRATGVYVTVGRFWTANFAAAYHDLEQKLAPRYDAVPEVRDVVISRCTLATAEPFIRAVNDRTSVADLLGAGFTTAADHTCLQQEVDDHLAWTRTTSSLAFNPYVAINPDGSTTRDDAFTAEMISYCRQRLSTRCVLENNSVRDPIQDRNNPGYASLYDAIAAAGPPIAFQTATNTRNNSLCNTLTWAVGQGAGAVELPQGYTLYTTMPGLASYDSGLNRTTPLDTTMPTAPANVAGTPSLTGGSVQLSWNPSSDSGYGVACYSVTRNGVAAPIGTTMATTFTDTAAPAGSNTYAITAVDGAGNVSPAGTTTVSSAPDIQPPSAPSGLGATFPSPIAARLTWTAATDNAGIDHYTVQRNGTAVGTVAAPDTFFDDSGLTPATSYTWDVLATDTSGNVSTSAAHLATSTPADTTAPAPPSSVTVLGVTQTGATLGWSGTTDDVGVTAYTVWRDGVSLGTQTAPFTDTSLLPNHTYSYTVTASDAAGNQSLRSVAAVATTASDTVAPSTPTGLRVTGITFTSVALAWTSSTDDVRVAGYHIYRNNVLVPSGPNLTLAFTDTGLTPGSSYTYRVAAYDYGPNGGNVSALSSSVTANTPRDTTPPTAPTALQITSGTTRPVALSWVASTDNSGAVAGYYVLRNGSKIATLGPQTTYSDFTARAGIKYTYKVKAFDASKNVSLPSNSVIVRPQ